MISAVPNKPHWPCENCRQVPAVWWSSACPKGCGHIVLACGDCASRNDVTRQLEGHVNLCAASLPSTPLAGLSGSAGFPSASSPTSMHSLIRRIANLGARIGAQRSAPHAAAGGALGALFGVVAGRVLNHPDVKPVVDVVQTLREPLEEVIAIVRSARRPLPGPPQEPPKST